MKKIIFSIVAFIFIISSSAYAVPPDAVLQSPLNASVTSYLTPVFMWNYVDPEVDPQVSFELQLSRDQNFSVSYSSVVDSSNAYWQPALVINEQMIVNGEISEGLYYWKARVSDSVWGAFSSTYTLTIDTTPPQNLSLNLTAHTSSVTITASAVDTSSMSYRITYSTSSDGFSSNISTTTAWIFGGHVSVSTQTLQLRPATTYYFQFNVKDSVDGDPYFSTSSVNNITTLPAIPGGVVWITTATTSSSVQIDWGASSPNDNPLTTVYTVKISTVTSDITTANYSSVTTRGAQTAIVSSLPVNTTCYAWVIATNWNIRSATFTVTGSTSTLSNPLLTPQISTMSWTQSQGYNLKITVNANGNPGYTEYLVLQSADSFLSPGTTVQTWTRLSSATTVYSTNLIGNTTYYYKVKSRNNGLLESSYSAVSSTVTAPRQANNPYVTSVSSTNISLGWTALSESKSYNVYYDTGAGGGVTNSINTTTTLTGLTPNTTHQIFVRSTNDYGEGMWSTAITTYTYAAVPGQPYFTNITSGSVKVYFDNIGNNSAFTLYQIHCLFGNNTYYAQSDGILTSSYNEYNNSVWFTSSTLGGIQGITIKGYDSQTTLPASTTYYFQVRAKNYYGNITAYSAVSSTLTLAYLQEPEPKVLSVSSNTIRIAIDKHSNGYSTYSVKVITEDGLTLYVDTATHTLTPTPTAVFADTTSWGGYVVDYGLPGEDLTNFNGGFEFTVPTPANRNFVIKLAAKNAAGVMYSDYATQTSTYTLPMAPLITLTAVNSNDLTIAVDTLYNSSHTVYLVKAISADNTTGYLNNTTHILSKTTLTWATTTQFGNFAINGLFANNGFSISVLARNATGLYSQYSNVISTWTKLLAVSSPTVTSAYSSTLGNHVKVSLNTLNSDFTKYAIYLTGPKGNGYLDGSGGVTVSTTASSYLFKSEWESFYSTAVYSMLGANETYTAKVKAYSPARDEYTAFSLESTAITPPAKPSQPLISIANNNITISQLVYSSTSTSIRIYVSTESVGSNLVNIATTQASSYIHTVHGSTPSAVSNSWTNVNISSIVINWSAVSAPAPSSTYYYSISEINSDGVEGQKSDLTSPGVSFQPVISNYKLYISTNIVLIQATSTQYIYNGLMPNTSYGYIITAVSDENYESSNSVLFSTFTLSALVVNSTGTTTWTQQEKYKNVITFNNNGNPASTRYAVSVSTGGAATWLSGSGSEGQAQVWLTSTTWIHTNLKPLTNYTYRVYSINAADVVTQGYADLSLTTIVISEIYIDTLKCYYSSSDLRQVSYNTQSHTLSPYFIWNTVTSSFTIAGYSVSWSSDPAVVPDNTLDSVSINGSTASWSASVTLSSGSAVRYYFKAAAYDTEGLRSEEKDFIFYFYYDLEQPVLADNTISLTGTYMYNSMYNGMSKNCVISVVFPKEMSVESLNSDNIYLESIFNNLEQSETGKILPVIVYDTSTKTASINATLKSNWTYDLVISTGVKDIVWNPLDKEYRARLRTVLSKDDNIVTVVKASIDISHETEIVMPPGCLNQDAYILINNNPVLAPRHAASGDITTANTKLSNKNDPIWYSEINMYDTSQNLINQPQFSIPLTFSMTYPDTNNDGIVDGTTVKADTLSIWWLDESKRAWAKISSNVDKTTRKITANINHFSVFAVVGSINLSVDDVEVAPVPWVPEDDNIDNGTLAQGIMFRNVPQEAEVYIYTITGNLVRKIVVTNHISQNDITWNGKTDDGSYAASGVYIWIVKNEASKKTGKLMIVR